MAVLAAKMKIQKREQTVEKTALSHSQGSRLQLGDDPHHCIFHQPNPLLH
jgi:hypothetical protein